MDDLLKNLLQNEILSEDTRNEITEGFKKILGEARAEIEKTVRSELAELYQNDIKKIAEAVDVYVNKHIKEEMDEFHGQMKGLADQRMKYVNAHNALKEQAQAAIKHRLSIFEKAINKALLKETKELHADLKTNRAATIKAITEAKAQATADREAFKQKGAKVLEHILNVKFKKEWDEIKEDIQKVRENDFGTRIFEAFMGEARRLFFNSHKELNNLNQQLAEQKKAYGMDRAKLLKKLEETQNVAKKAISDNKKIQESAIRSKAMNRMLATIPSGAAREQMKTLLESSATADLEKTFKKYANVILKENNNKVRPNSKPILEGAIRNGNGRQLESVEDDDQEIINLRRLSGIK